MIEEAIQKSIFSQNNEKSLNDKILAREDVNRLRDLIRKDPLVREDMLEILYLLSGVESKLVNYGEWDRYIILKFFVWIREFVKVCELMYDFEDDLKKKNWQLSRQAQTILANNRRIMQHNTKFLVDLYLNISRTTLSKGGALVKDLTTNKYDIAYPQIQAFTPPKN